jgi:hypothetical protein
MPCVEQTKGRYVAKNRKSPPYLAQECKNQAKVGRDQTMWISLPDKNLKYTWKPYGGTAHKKAVSNLPPFKEISKRKNGGKAPLKGILKEPRTKSKEKKKVSFKNGNGNPKKSRGLEGLTVVELRQKAKDRGLKGYSGKSKAALVAMLRKGNGKGASAKKSSSKKTTSSRGRKAAGYTKKKGATGQTLYYKNGNRVAKKNVPVKYQ